MTSATPNDLTKAPFPNNIKLRISVATYEFVAHNSKSINTGRYLTKSSCSRIYLLSGHFST